MPATITQVVKQFQQHWLSQLAPDAILTACRSIAYGWRERTLNPVTTIELFVVQILHGNTACTHPRHLTKPQVMASAYCQARRKLPLAVLQQLVRSVSHALQHEPLDEGRWYGHRAFWVDGSSFSIPDTPALQDHFGQSSTQLPGCGFPIAHFFLHAGTGMVIHLWAAPCVLMISPRWSGSIRACAPGMSWSPLAASVPMLILPCSCRLACMPCSA